MQDSLVPLIVAAGAFLALLLWRVRPVAFWTTKRRVSREALREAWARIEAAPGEPERARALCDAADLLARQVRGRGSATGFYLRAMRSDPKSVEVIERAVAGLARRPRALESILWRHLAIVRWKESSESTRATLDALRALYEGQLRNAVRARALANARETLTGSD
jgi:hypothetical protein